MNELFSVYSSNPEALIVAGAVDFMNNRKNSEQTIIDISEITELKKIRRTEKYIDIGSTLPISHIILIGQNVLPTVLYKSLKNIASPSIRNLSTLGGNICIASSYSDSLPSLFALDALLEIKSQTNIRWVPISQFILSAGKNDLKPGEILTRIRIPLKSLETQIFKKIRTGQFSSFATITFCGLASITKNMINDIRLSFGSVNPTVIRSRRLETPFIGHKLPLSKREVNQFLLSLKNELNPINDSISTALYRTNTSLRLAKWFLQELKEL